MKIDKIWAFKGELELFFDLACPTLSAKLTRLGILVRTQDQHSVAQNQKKAKHFSLHNLHKPKHKTRKKSYKFILYLVLIVVLTWISGLSVFFNNKNNGKENADNKQFNSSDCQSTNSLENLKMSKNSTYQNCEFEFSCQK